MMRIKEMLFGNKSPDFSEEACIDLNVRVHSLLNGQRRGTVKVVLLANLADFISQHIDADPQRREEIIEIYIEDLKQNLKFIEEQEK